MARHRASFRRASVSLSAVLLALQIWLGPGAMLRAAEPDPIGAFVICHADGGAAAPNSPAAPHGDCCTLCPLCHTLASGVLPPEPAPPRPSLVWARPAVPLPPARAPPPGLRPTPYDPTGPPSLS